ncbi:BofC C-terminal domain-containing protein [Fervidibacillus halotolerans]|uniref:BofC C-terminal domain-containing protein n=1 Tax=Fervidibacillus halotolerans TaxID=2980027 RepID=A0A9E8LXK3_9BACI|nr:BofC C-terminal domain-containing protein [Fervidibacillus halotolerans]WAA11573.1 BofC C-terminal domain-containing protein [Fervidibacillus halotolerans]
MNNRVGKWSLMFLSFIIFPCLFHQPLHVEAIHGMVGKDVQKKLFIFLRQSYLDGETSETVIPTYVNDSQQDLQRYLDQGWELRDQNAERIILEKRVNDISPLLKSNGFFGITEDGTLSIFDGKPDENKVIHSFFQIDIKKLEVRKQEELKKGIPVRSKDTYFQVIQAFYPYSKYSDQ